MKEKEIKNEELKATETQETEVQENQQEEAPKEEQKQEEKDDKPEKAKESIWSKAGKAVKAGATKTWTIVRKAAPIVLGIAGGVAFGKVLGKCEAYQELTTVDSGEDIKELPGNTEEPADSVIEDAEFKEITADESQSE